VVPLPAAVVPLHCRGGAAAADSGVAGAGAHHRPL